MSTLQDHIKSHKPYINGVRIKVLFSDETKETRFVVGDASDAIELLVYDEQKLRFFKAGRCLMLFNVITKMNYATPRLEVNDKTKVKNTGQIEVPEIIQKKAEEIIHSVSAFAPIKDVATSPVKAMLSIKGTIVEQEMPATVSVRGRPLAMQNITLKDSTSKCRVTLWKDIPSDLNIGDHIEITNTIIKNYKQENYLSTTQTSVVKKCQMPEKAVTIIAYEITHNKVVLTSDEENYPEYTVDTGLLLHALDIDGEDDLINSLDEKVPFDCTMKSKPDGSMAISM